jgi:membrane protein YqaA with SNARE-associated domain
LARTSGRRWFLPAAAAIPAADFLMPALPAQFALATAATLRPARPLLIAALFALSAGIGAAMAASAVQAFGLTAQELADRGFVSAERAREGAELVRAHGFTALVVLALLPLPPRAATLLAAAAGMSPLAIGAAVALGRTVPSSCLALLAARAPGSLRRFRLTRRLADRLATLQAEAAEHREQACQPAG